MTAATLPSRTTKSRRGRDLPARVERWFRRHRRELPFRPTDDRPANPYHVLVSELMAQQTQIATVVPYFERFVAAFPTVEALAAADEQAVLKLWQGLGYYRRARSLHAAAKAVVAVHGGQVPATAEALSQLPGVGRYTAGAVASVAYDRPEAVVDGNVARVLSRLDRIEEPVDRPAGQRQLWARAEELVEAAASPRDFNQGLMELGALVCTPRSPKCLVCPVRESCQAHAAGVAERLPGKTPKKKPVAVTHTVLAVCHGDELLFERRPGDGLWANLWQLPTAESDDATPVPPAAVADRRGLRLTGEPRRVGDFTHATTHRTIRFELFTADIKPGTRPPKGGCWRLADDLADLPLAKPQTRALAMLGGIRIPR
ncbi:MAG: A/G-specific adenine glycosylase [Planctomycetota bacterium]